MNLLAPLGLALGTLLIPLTALYFLKIRRQKVIVPSTFLWQELAKVERLSTPFERFRRNLLWLLQLLLLLLATIALARPYFQSDLPPGRAVVLVLDTSASMGALDGAPTRFDDAKKAALDVVNGLSSGDEAMLVVAGPPTEVRVAFTNNHADLRTALKGLSATEADGSLRDAVELALSVAKTRPGVQVVVFSDGGGESLSDLPSGGADIRFVNAGSASSNVGIVALDLRRSPSSDLERQVFVTVENYGLDEVKASVELYLDGKQVGLRADPVAPNSPVSMVFDLSGTATGELKAVLSAPGDLLPADNQAFAIVEESQERRVLLVGGDRLTARILAADPRFQVDVVSATGFKASQLVDYDAAVFGGEVPSGVEGHSYLVLGPYSGGPVVFGEKVPSPAILGWRRTHPSMRFVEWDGVSIGQAKRVDNPGGLLTVVDGDIGPLVLAGEKKGGRVVELAFDPLNSDLPLRIAYPVLILNTVGWLTESGSTQGAGAMLPTGTAFMHAVEQGLKTATVVGPRGKEDLAISDDMLRVRDTYNVGIYKVQAGGLQTKFAANLLSPRESRIAPRSTLDLAGNTQVAASSGVTGQREIWRDLLLFAVGLLVVEWVLWNRRRVG